MWTNYLVEGLGFSNFELGVITIASCVFSWLALYIYKAFFFDVNWQYIYYFTTLINVILSVLQLLLVFGETGDIPKLVFATGDYAFISFSMCACLLSLLFILNCLLVSERLNCDRIHSFCDSIQICNSCLW